MRRGTFRRSPAIKAVLPLLFILTILLLALAATRGAAAQARAVAPPGTGPIPARPLSLACAPVKPIAVTATRIGDELVLSWPSDPANYYFEIYHGTTPYFSADSSTWVDTVHAPANIWVSTSALLTNGDDYYVVKAQGCGGDKYTSNRVGVTMFRPPLPGIIFGDARQGKATYYWEADGGGNCMFPPTPGDVMVGAVATFDYGPDARLCGAYARVQGPFGQIQVRIVDRCPDVGCNAGHIDLHPEAFKEIAPLEYGRVNITWELVSPPMTGNIHYHFKDASNRWWAAIQVRNHRNPLARFEVLQGGQWVTLPRQEWNYFLASSGLGAGPFTFRVTDIFGNQIVTRDVPLLDNATWPGGAQFPPAP